MKAAKIFIFVLVMGSASGALLVGVDSFTSPIILRNEELRLRSSVLDALEIPYETANVSDIFDSKIRLLTAAGDKFYSSADGTIAFEFSGPGLWGPILGIASVNPDLRTIRAIKILHQEETPGLGGRIAELAYLRQFRGKEFFPRLLFVAEGHAAAKNEVDAITGATGSSKALEKLLNETLQKNVTLLKRRGR